MPHRLKLSRSQLRKAGAQARWGFEALPYPNDLGPSGVTGIESYPGINPQERGRVEIDVRIIEAREKGVIALRR